MLRAIIILICAILYLIIMLPVMIILMIIKSKDPAKAARIARLPVAWIFRVFIFISGSRYEVKGLDNIPDGESVLFVSNHRSYFDIIAGYGHLTIPTGFVAKDMLMKVPLFATWMDLIGCIGIKRDDIKQSLGAIVKAISYVKKGISIWICPEGGRGRDDDPMKMLPFKEGSLKIASKTGCNIVPVAILGTREVFEKHFPSVRPSHIKIIFGKPYRIKNLDDEWAKKSGEYTRDIISTMMKEEIDGI